MYLKGFLTLESRDESEEVDLYSRKRCIYVLCEVCEGEDEG